MLFYISLLVFTLVIIKLGGGEMKKPKVPFGTIYRRGKKGIFYFENRKKGVNPTSLKTSDPDLAIEKSIERFGYLQFQDEIKQQQHVLSQLQHVKHNLRTHGYSLKLEDIETEFLKSLKRSGKSKGKKHVDATDLPLSPGTIQNYRTKIKQFREWLKENHPEVKAMHHVTPYIADSYLEEVRDTRKAKTYNTYLGHLRNIWEKLSIKAGIDENPFEKVNQIPRAAVNEDIENRKAFTIEELKMIFDKVQGTEWETPCRLAYETGLRLGDICHIKLEQIKLKEGFLDLRHGTRKSGKEHMFYIPDSIVLLRDLIKKKNIKSGYVFAYFYENYKARNNLSAKFGLLLQSIGFKTQITNEFGRKQAIYGFHSFRASHATLLASGGASINEVQSALGHSNQNTTKGYIQEDDDSLMRKLITNHQALPLAGGSIVDTLIEQINQSIGKLNQKERKTFKKKLKRLIN